MKEKTTIAGTIDAAEEKIRYDEACKKLLAEKIILAWILKNCLDEYADFDVREIASRYIEGTPHIAEIPVGVDQSAAPLIRKCGTEDVTITEGTVTYDIRFSAIAPDSGELVGLIINVEAQNDFYPGYPLVKRALYYCSRMISAQYGTEFTNSHYEKLQKVYSIWICMNPPKNRQDTITRYVISEKNILGSVREDRKNYDLLSAIMICLGEHTRERDPDATAADELIRLLNVLLSSDTTAEEKKHILTDEYDIPMTQSFERQVDDMCNLSSGVEARGIEKGISQGIEKGISQGIETGILLSILNLMETMKFSAGQAMDALKIPAEKRDIYAQRIKEQCHF